MHADALLITQEELEDEFAKFPHVSSGELGNRSMNAFFPLAFFRHVSIDAVNPNKIQVIANLPFSVATTLLFQWLKWMASPLGMFSHPNVEMILMFQKEVAQVILRASEVY